jgi:hypothetical protein
MMGEIGNQSIVGPDTGPGGHSFHFSVEVREIDNGFIVRIGDHGKWTEHAFLPSRADRIPLFISERCVMAMERRREKA